MPCGNNNKENFVDIAGINIKEVISRAIKYLIEGLAVAVAAYYIPRRKMMMEEIAMIAVTSALTFAILDMYSPSIATAARRGAGFGIGAASVGYKGPLVEGMCSQKKKEVEGMCSKKKEEMSY